MKFSKALVKLFVTLTIAGSLFIAFAARELTPDLYQFEQIMILDPTAEPISLSAGVAVPEEIRSLRSSTVADFLKKEKGWAVAQVIQSTGQDKVMLVKRHSNFSAILLKSFVFMVFPSTAATVLLYGLLMYGYLFRQGKVAHSVLKKLQSGDLEARMPEATFVLFRGTAAAFNSMADAIASLMKRLKVAEAQRSEIVQELVHDVRTPLTSLQLALEDLGRSAETAKASGISQELEVCTMEINYLNGLINGLVILAQLEDPTHEFREDVESLSVLQNEIAVSRNQKENRKFRFVTMIEKGVESILRGERSLLARAIRNQLTNAAHHTKSLLSVSVGVEKTQLRILIRDDGPGFSEENIRNFGERRTRRIIEASEDRRISVGLGSSVSKRIIESFGGTIAASNWEQGGQIEILLPAVRVERPTAKAA